MSGRGPAPRAQGRVAAVSGLAVWVRGPAAGEKAANPTSI